MGKYLVTCSIAILFLLLQTDVIFSVSGKSTSSSRSRKPSKPSRPVHHRPSKPVEHRPIKPIHHLPSKPAHNQPVHNPAPPQHNPVYPPVNPGKPPRNPGNPPPQNPAYPPQNPAYPPRNPGNPPPQNPAYPPQNPGNPVHPPQNPAYPPQNPGNPVHPPQNPAYPPRNPGNPPPQNPAYPPQNPGNPVYPPQNPAYPPQNPAYPPRNPGNPPPQNPAYPPQNPAYPPQNPAHPPLNPGYPPQNPGYPPHNPGNPHNPGYPPQNPGYPPHNPGYPPQNPGYPPHNPGNPHNPGYPQHNPGFPQNPGYPRYGEGGNLMPWKPKPPKTKLKHVVGAGLAGAAAGAVGGYLLGRAMSNINFQFNNRDDERWWYENRNRYSDQVYYPPYNEPVPQDTFVRDCTNITVREYTEPSGNQTADEMETRVVTHVVREMCIEQYRIYSGPGGGGSFSRPESRPERPMLAKTEVKPVEEETIAGAVVKDRLGSSVSNIQLHFNDSDEERWWGENRHRFTTHVFSPNYSRPVSKEDFVSDCENATGNYYIKLTGNQTADEVDARMVRQVAQEMCRELYNDFMRHMEGSNYDQKPAAPMPTKLWLKHAPEAANIKPGTGDTGSHGNDAMSHIHGNIFAKSFVFLIIAVATPFLIP